MASMITYTVASALWDVVQLHLAGAHRADASTWDHWRTRTCVDGSPCGTISLLSISSDTPLPQACLQLRVVIEAMHAWLQVVRRPQGGAEVAGGDYRAGQEGDPRAVRDLAAGPHAAPARPQEQGPQEGRTRAARVHQYPHPGVTYLIPLPNPLGPYLPNPPLAALPASTTPVPAKRARDRPTSLAHHSMLRTSPHRAAHSCTCGLCRVHSSRAQGSAADVASSAMLAIDKCEELKRMGWRLVMQVCVCVCVYVCMRRACA